MASRLELVHQTSWEPGVWRANRGPLLALAAAGLMWAVSLIRLDLSAMGDLGLVTILPATYLLALVVLVISACLTIGRIRMPHWLWLLHPVAWILMLHATPNLVYGTLRYSWAWKHVGIVDYIQRHGQVDPGIHVLSAYHNWPGFFTLNALLTEAAGFDSALAYAGWAPVFFNLINLGAVWLIFTALTDDPRLIRLSTWLFFIVNWVGQDYFSPQALNFFLHLVVVGACLHWLRPARVPTEAWLKRWLIWGGIARLAVRLFERAHARRGAVEPLSPAARAGLVVSLVLMLAAIASSHQLTPFMTLLGLLILVLIWRCNARSLPLIAGLLTFYWIAYMTTAFMPGELEDLQESIGQLTRNVDSSLRSLGSVGEGERLVALMARGLTLSTWALAVLGGLRRLANGQADLAVAALALMPFAILSGSSYGGEILFRVYLFGLPFMVFLAAGLVFPTRKAGASWAAPAMTLLMSGVLVVGFVFAYYGKEEQYHFSQDEVDAAEFLYRYAPPGSLLIEGARNYPSQFLNYEHFTYVPIASEDVEAREEIIAEPVEVLSRWLSNSDYAATYLIITRSQKAMVEALGDMPVGALDGMEAALRQSGKFRLLYANADAAIYILDTPPAPGPTRQLGQ